VDIKVQKRGDVSVRDQLFAQIAFLIATRALKPGDTLPSVRALARQLRIHHNTISQAYHDLVDKDFLVRRRGSRMVVRIPEQPRTTSHQDLDDLINQTVRMARQHGYTMQQLTQRVRERLLEEPPDHILALSPDSGMRRLLEAELHEALQFSVRSCSPDELIVNPALAAGALVVSPPGFLPSILPALPKIRPAIPIVYSSAAQHLKMVRQLARPSLVVIISVSERFIEIARGLLSPVAGRRHSVVGYLVDDGRAPAPNTADILFCDVIALGLLRGAVRKAIPYRLISPECLSQIASAMAL
jgi:DNA-binding transcriptional regulator YhcF (GntR family)